MSSTVSVASSWVSFLNLLDSSDPEKQKMCIKDNAGAVDVVIIPEVGSSSFVPLMSRERWLHLVTPIHPKEGKVLNHCGF